MTCRGESTASPVCAKNARTVYLSSEVVLPMAVGAKQNALVLDKDSSNVLPGSLAELPPVIALFTRVVNVQSSVVLIVAALRALAPQKLNRELLEFGVALFVVRARALTALPAGSSWRELADGKVRLVAGTPLLTSWRFVNPSKVLSRTFARAELPPLALRLGMVVGHHSFADGADGGLHETIVP